MIDNKIQILDTTLRDGSYVIDFQFTQDDTKTITRCLDKIGIGLIEIGHGVGINAGTGKGAAAATDVEYVRAAKSVAKNSKIGMFCIPGIATKDTLLACIDAGLDFVRIGVNVDQINQSEEFIKIARQKNVFVCSNFMKSYVMKPNAYAKIVKQSEEYGSQMIYVVDSAGGMLPNEIKEYVQCARAATAVPLGFHGHNNIGLAVANALAAIEAGVAVVDTTLLGLGRSSGNVPTEIMVPLLQRQFGACQGIDEDLLLDLGETLIAPLLRNRWENTQKTSLGLARVHSMYADKIVVASREAKKMCFSTIREVGSRDCLNLPPEVLKASISAAKEVDAVRKFFGDVTLVEKISDASSFEDIRRAALKQNIPVLLVVTERGKVRLQNQRRQISYEVPVETALKFLKSGPGCTVCVRVAEKFLAQHNELKEATKGLEIELY